MCFFVCGLILWILNLTFTCFTCAGVTKKLCFRNFGDDILLFGDQNIKDMKDTRAVDSDDEEAPLSRLQTSQDHCCATAAPSSTS